MRLTKTFRLLIMIVLASSFSLVENIVSYITNSIAVTADSFHMLSYVVSLVVGVACVRIAKRPSERNTFGWIRVEVLGALVNAVFLVALSFSILVESIRRLYIVEEIASPKLMLTMGGFGILINLVGLLLFHDQSYGTKESGDSHHLVETEELLKSPGAASSMSSISQSSSSLSTPVSVESGLHHDDEYSTKMKHDEIRGTDQHISLAKKHVVIKPADAMLTIDTDPKNKLTFKESGPRLASSGRLNIKGVFVHVLSDVLGSVIVIFTGLVAWFVKNDLRLYVDPLMGIVMVLINLLTTVPLFKESAFILLQAVPSHIHSETIRSKLEKIEGIRDIHEFHVWQLAGNSIVATAHVAFLDVFEYMDLASKIKLMFHNEGIHSTTIQPEFIHYQTGEVVEDKQCADLCWEKTCRKANKCCCSEENVKKSQSAAGANISAVEINEGEM